MERKVPLTRILTACVAVLWVAGACGSDAAQPPTGTDDVDVTTSTAPSTTADEAAEAVEVRVYFVEDEKLATAGRIVDAPAVARGAIEALLQGPEGIETELEMGSAVPAGTELIDLAIDDGTATIDLSSAFESGGGSLSMQLRVAQVVFTLTQFESVSAVDFRIDGTPVDAIGGEGIPAEGVGREDLTNVTPLILVESPVPGEAVSSPLQITGWSNTFEATVQYAVTDGDGLIIDEGFTTATAGNGTFGTFSITSTFDVDVSGTGAVIAFEESAADGSQVNVYEVAVGIS